MTIYSVSSTEGPHARGNFYTRMLKENSKELELVKQKILFLERQRELSTALASESSEEYSSEDDDDNLAALVSTSFLSRKADKFGNTKGGGQDTDVVRRPLNMKKGPAQPMPAKTVKLIKNKRDVDRFEARAPTTVELAIKKPTKAIGMKKNLRNINKRRAKAGLFTLKFRTGNFHKVYAAATVDDVEMFLKNGNKGIGKHGNKINVNLTVSDDTKYPLGKFEVPPGSERTVGSVIREVKAGNYAKSLENKEHAIELERKTIVTNRVIVRYGLETLYISDQEAMDQHLSRIFKRAEFLLKDKIKIVFGYFHRLAPAFTGVPNLATISMIPIESIFGIPLLFGVLIKMLLGFPILPIEYRESNYSRELARAVKSRLAHKPPVVAYDVNSMFELPKLNRIFDPKFYKGDGKKVVDAYSTPNMLFGGRQLPKVVLPALKPVPHYEGKIRFGNGKEKNKAGSARKPTQLSDREGQTLRDLSNLLPVQRYIVEKDGIKLLVRSSQRTAESKSLISDGIGERVKKADLPIAPEADEVDMAEFINEAPAESKIIPARRTKRDEPIVKGPVKNRIKDSMPFSAENKTKSKAERSNEYKPTPRESVAQMGLDVDQPKFDSEAELLEMLDIMGLDSSYVVSQLNGSHGEATNEDDVKLYAVTKGSPAIVKVRSVCDIHLSNLLNYTGSAVSECGLRVADERSGTECLCYQVISLTIKYDSKSYFLISLDKFYIQIDEISADIRLGEIPGGDWVKYFESSHGGRTKTYFYKEIDVVLESSPIECIGVLVCDTGSEQRLRLEEGAFCLLCGRFNNSGFTRCPSCNGNNGSFTNTDDHETFKSFGDFIIKNMLILVNYIVAVTICIVSFCLVPFMILIGLSMTQMALIVVFVTFMILCYFYFRYIFKFLMQIVWTVLGFWIGWSMTRELIKMIKGESNQVDQNIEWLTQKKDQGVREVRRRLRKLDRHRVRKDEAMHFFCPSNLKENNVKAFESLRRFILVFDGKPTFSENTRERLSVHFSESEVAGAEQIYLDGAKIAPLVGYYEVVVHLCTIYDSKDYGSDDDDDGSETSDYSLSDLDRITVPSNEVKIGGNKFICNRVKCKGTGGNSKVRAQPEAFDDDHEAAMRVLEKEEDENSNNSDDDDGILWLPAAHPQQRTLHNICGQSLSKDKFYAYESECSPYCGYGCVDIARKVIPNFDLYYNNQGNTAMNVFSRSDNIAIYAKSVGVNLAVYVEENETYNRVLEYTSSPAFLWVYLLHTETEGEEIGHFTLLVERVSDYVHDTLPDLTVRYSFQMLLRSCFLTIAVGNTWYARITARLGQLMLLGYSMVNGFEVRKVYTVARYYYNINNLDRRSVYDQTEPVRLSDVYATVELKYQLHDEEGVMQKEIPLRTYNISVRRFLNVYREMQSLCAMNKDPAMGIASVFSNRTINTDVSLTNIFFDTAMLARETYYDVLFEADRNYQAGSYARNSVGEESVVSWDNVARVGCGAKSENDIVKLRLEPSVFKKVAVCPIGAPLSNNGYMGPGLICNNQPVSQLMAFLNRSMTEIPRKPDVVAEFLQFGFAEIDRLLTTCPQVTVPEPEVTEYFKEHYRGKKTQHYINLVLSNYDLFKKGHCVDGFEEDSCFVKFESNIKAVTNDDGDEVIRGKPRLIMVMSQRKLVELCRLIKLFDLWNDGEIRDFQIKHCTIEEMSKKISEVSTAPHTVTDYSSFEASVNVEIRKLESYLIVKLCDKYGFTETRESYIRFNTETRNMKTKYGVYRIGTRCSGDFWTSTGNGLVNYLIAKFCAIKRGYQLTRGMGIFEGDDGITRSEVMDKGLVANLGFNYSTDLKGYVDGDCDFLQKRWIGGKCYLNIGRAMRIFWVKKACYLPRWKQLFLLRAAAYSMHHLSPGHPVLWAIVRRICYLTAGANKFKYWDSYFDRWHAEQIDADMVSNNLRPEVDESMRGPISEGANGFPPIPASMQVELEERILRGDYYFGDILSGYTDFEQSVKSNFVLVEGEVKTNPEVLSAIEDMSSRIKVKGLGRLTNSLVFRG